MYTREALLILRHRIGRWRQLLRCYLKKWTNKRAVYYVMTPEHGNLGDHAITQATIQILNQLGIPFIPVSTDKLKEWEDKKLLHIMNGRPILINGGGNLGTIWFSLERLIRNVIICNPSSRILILPNTIYYDNSNNGRKQLELSKCIYNSHSKLTVYARERITYNLARELYNHVKLIPDLALYLDYSTPKLHRNGCVICLRSDKEKTLTKEEETGILRVIKSLFGDNISFQDMNIHHMIAEKDREHELNKQIDIFKHAQIVITDRLHGMILCAITATPCVVLNSKSTKIKGCYEWLENLEYIQICDDLSELSARIQDVLSKENNYDNSGFLPYFAELKKDIQYAYKH